MNVHSKDSTSHSKSYFFGGWGGGTGIKKKKNPATWIFLAREFLFCKCSKHMKSSAICECVGRNTLADVVLLNVTEVKHSVWVSSRKIRGGSNLAAPVFPRAGEVRLKHLQSGHHSLEQGFIFSSAA